MLSQLCYLTSKLKSLSCVQLWSPWNSPGQNTGMGSPSLLQGIFPTQGPNPGLLHCRRILYQLSHKGSPRILEWVAYPFSRRSSQPRVPHLGLPHCRQILSVWATRKALKSKWKNCKAWRHSTVTNDSSKILPLSPITVQLLQLLVVSLPVASKSIHLAWAIQIYEGRDNNETGKLCFKSKKLTEWGSGKSSEFKAKIAGAWTLALHCSFLGLDSLTC